MGLYLIISIIVIIGMYQECMTQKLFAKSDVRSLRIFIFSFGLWILRPYFLWQIIIYIFSDEIKKDNQSD